MNVFRIAFKELKQSLRDWRPNALMVLMPIIFMVVLGAALSGKFAKSIVINVDALYSATGQGPLQQAFEAFRTSVEAMGVRLARVEESEGAFKSVRDASRSCYLVISDSGITLYKNAKFAFEAEFVRSLVTVFLGRYNAAAAVAAVDPALLPRLAVAFGTPAVKMTSLEGNRRASSFDYYGVTMVPFIVLFASMFGMSAIKKEQRLRTANRILSAPVRPLDFLAGKVVGGLAVTTVQVAVALAFSRYVLGAYWGKDMGTVALVLMSEVLMAVSIGAGTAFLIKNEGAATGILNVLFPVLATFGDTYVPAFVTPPVLRRIADFNPLALINRALFGVIYNADYSAVFRVIGLCAGVSVVFLASAALLARKETA